MAMKGNQGISSKNLVHPKVRTGTGSRGTHPGGVAQLGQHVGDKATHGNPKGSGYRGEPLHNNRNFQKTPFGNEIAANTVCKPGGSREVMRSGGQGLHGDVAGSRPGQARGILNNE
jgi:hypothetical protein